VTGVFVTAAAAYAWPSEPWPPTGDTFVGEVDEFELGSVTPLWNLDIDGYLVRLEDGGFLAFDRAEPVFGCTLLWDRQGERSFWDACHGYECDIAGHPSPDNPVRIPMNQLELNIDHRGTIRVTTPVEPR
jgi:hypothetical protein